MKVRSAWQGQCLLVLLCLLLLVPLLATPRSFWVLDEVRHAEVVRTMVEEGGWLVPQLNGHPFGDRPPLYFWLCAALCRAMGRVSAVIFLLVSWGGGVGMLLATFRLGIDIVGLRRAFLGALILLTSLLFIASMHIARMDMLSACGVVLALYAFYTGHRTGRPIYRALGHLCAWGVLMLGGVLPFVVTCAVPVAVMGQRRAWRELRQHLASWGVWAGLAGVLLWAAAVWQQGDVMYVKTVLITDLLRRIPHAEGGSAPSTGRVEPFLFYLKILPALLVAWIPFLPRALFRRSGTASPDARSLIFWWAAGGLVLISLAPRKMMLYPLPLLPPVALLIGAYLSDIILDRTRAGWCFRLEGVLAVLLGCGLPAAVPLVAARIAAFEDVPMWPLAALFLPLGLVGLYVALRGQVRSTCRLLVTSSLALFLMGGLWLVPRIDDLCSGRSLATELAGARAAGRTVAGYRVTRDLFDFYAGGNVPPVPSGELVNSLMTTGSVVVTRERYWREFRDALPESVMVRSRHFVVDRPYVILENYAHD